MKNAIANSSMAIHISMRPKPNTMIRMAPTKSSVPAVPNSPVFDFSVVCFSDLLKKNVAIMAKIQSITKTATITMITLVISGRMSSGFRFAVLGVRFGKVDQSPFQPGYNSIMKSLMFERLAKTAAIATPTDMTTPTTPIIIP